MNFEEITLNEADFFVKHSTLIEILPNFFEDTITFISGSFGPFKPSKPVPLWFAMYLKQKNLCRIIPPDFLNCDTLQLILDDEKIQKDSLSDLPSTSPYYFEICQLLLKNASDDLPNSTKIRHLLEDIESIREKKIQDWQNKMNEKDSFFDAKNFTFYEINKRRKVLDEVLKELQTIKSKKDDNIFASQNSSLISSQSQRISQY